MGIANAVSIRVSRPGLDAIEQNLPAIASSVVGVPGGKLTIDIPTTQAGSMDLAAAGITVASITPNVCPNGADPNANPPTCQAQANLGASTFTIDAVKPNAVVVHAVVPLVLQNAPISAQVKGLDLIPMGSITLYLGYGDGGCSGGGGNGSPIVTPHALPITITIPLVPETTAPRTGYTKLDIDNAVIDLSGLSSDNVQICANCGFASNICDAITNSATLKNLVVTPMTTQLASQIKSMLAAQLCTAPNPALDPPCPTGTSPDISNTKCVFNSAPTKCVPTLLGTDAHANLGGLLASISPGSAGALDFGLAATGAMNPAPGGNTDNAGHTTNGITLSMIGGVIPQPLSKCVSQASVTLPTGIPVPDEIAPSTADTASTPHVGIALAERFIDYSVKSSYNSGLFCLGISTEQVDMLKAGLLSLLIPSIKNLTFEQGNAAAAITTRPQAPPSITVGAGTADDPLLVVTLPKFAIDFYIWNLDRFVRAFTFEADLTIPVNIQTGKGPASSPNAALMPSLGDVKVANGVVTNADLLFDDPVVIASALSGLVSGMSKQLVGSLQPIDVSNLLASTGMSVEVTGIQELSKGNDNFIGIFANLAAASTTTLEADTTATLASKTVHADHMQLSTYDPVALPELVVDVSSPLDNGTYTIEYSWWIDTGTRSSWSTNKRLTIQDAQLFLQGHHVLKVAARVMGQPSTEDATPAEVPFVIDALAPFTTLKNADGIVTVDAWDLISPKSSLVGRYRLDGAEFGDFESMDRLASIRVGRATTLDVEVKDEEGNIGQVHQDLIRGQADSTLAAGSSCGCSTPGSRSSTSDNTMALLLGLAGTALIGLRRLSRRRYDVVGSSLQRPATSRRVVVVALGSIGAIAGASQGCSCGSNASTSNTMGCGADCNQECTAPVGVGQPGSYTSVAKAADGTIWVAGYNDSLIANGNTLPFGDLVVGTYDPNTQTVTWSTVDGLPTHTNGSCPPAPKASWRNGEVDPGDDVGLWTSIQVTTNNQPIVTYYDATNQRLKLAVREANENGAWTSSVLAQVQGGDVGRYAKMILVDGKPTVAFLQIEPTTSGQVRSKVVVAAAKIEVPRGPSDFTFEDAAIEENNPCRADDCPTGQVCVKSTGTCVATASGCAPACGSSSACVTVNAALSCETLQGSVEAYPNVFGDYISLANGPNGLGIAVYDRVHGNLVGLSNNGGTWNRIIVDGEVGNRDSGTAVDTGDKGIGASLAIDGSGTWHMSYVSGLDETLRYVTMNNNAVPGTPEIVDDGTAVDGKAFADGVHVVGDDSTIRVDGDVVTIYYQDATVGVLRRAIGTMNGTTHNWSLRSLPQPNKFGGYFPQFVPDENNVANFWRQTDHATLSVSADVSILSPP